MTDPSTAATPHTDAASRGRLVEGDADPALLFDRMLPASITDVWSAITEHDSMGRWAFTGHIEPRTGGSVRFTATPDEPAEGEVLVWDQPHVLEYEWGEGEESWRVRFDLTERGERTSLQFRHLHPDPANPEFAAGWHWHLDRLHQLLEGAKPDDVDEDKHFQDLMEQYQD